MLHEHGIIYDAKHHRLRCQGHIINLSVNSFLYVTDNEAIDEKDEDATLLKPSIDEIQQWRKYGPIGKLHNIVVDIQSSPQRMQEFLLLSKNQRPARDNKTRWNSFAKMTKRALTSPVYEAILAYLQRHSADAVAQDALSPDEWETLRQIHEFLDLLAQTTLGLESSTSTLDAVLPAMDFILEQFETYKVKHHGHVVLSTMFNSGWKKMSKYYDKSTESPAYTAAIVLNPNFKWSYITINWDPSWIPDAKNMMMKLWEAHKSKIASDEVDLPAQPPVPILSSGNDFKAWMKRNQKTPNQEDEYTRYCAMDCTFDVDGRTWWQEKTQRTSFPVLSNLALDILSIPAMSADPERLFSSAKHLLSDLRNKLGMDIVEAFECLKSWYRLQKIKDQSQLDTLIGGDDM
jgi:hAT family C-terminal dimerisation region